MRTTRIRKPRLDKVFLHVRHTLETHEIEKLIELLQARVIQQKEWEARPINDPTLPPHDGPKQWLEEKMIGKHGPYLYLRYELGGKRKSRYLKGLKRGDPIPWITKEEEWAMRVAASI